MQYTFNMDKTFSDVTNFHKTLVITEIHISFLYRDLNQCIMEWMYSELVKIKHTGPL